MKLDCITSSVRLQHRYWCRICVLRADSCFVCFRVITPGSNAQQQWTSGPAASCCWKWSRASCSPGWATKLPTSLDDSREQSRCLETTCQAMMPGSMALGSWQSSCFSRTLAADPAWTACCCLPSSPQTDLQPSALAQATLSGSSGCCLLI